MSPGEIDRARFIASLKAVGALQFGTFTLASGRTSPYHVDIKRAVTRPDLLRTIAEGMAPYARDVDRIAGVELGAVPIAAAIGLVSGKPYVMVRKSAKEHGTKHEVEGDLNRGDRVLFVEDVVTTGGTLRAAIERMRGHGGLIEGCVGAVDPQEGGRMLLSHVTAAPHALPSAQDLLEAA